jgi:hypothetical protein
MRYRHRSKKSSRTQSRFRKLLSRILDEPEVGVVLGVLESERKGKPFRAGRLGTAQSLVARGWLVRDVGGEIHLGGDTRALLVESERRP